MVGDTILIKDISINGNDNLTNADQLSETLTDNTINALGIDASSRTIWINGQPYGNAYVNVKEGGTLEKPIGGEIFNDFENNIASGEYSHAEGHVTSATNANAHAEGTGTTASGIASHSEGYYSTASGTVSHAEGYQTTATKTASHAEGQNTKAIGSVSHAEGYNTIASASYSHAEGSQSVASGQSSHAEGNQTSAAGVCSHAEGFKTQTTNKGEHAEGLSNVSIQGKTVHTVGIGSAEDNVEDRKNAEEIHLDGKHYVYGIGGYDGTNSEDDDVKTVQTVVNESINQITISYLKLKELRDASQLVPGKEYRINDYTCTTTQTGTRSAGNVFDIIVTADSESTLNEEARAINHEFDAPNQDHFKDCNLNAWQIWYCLDNDTTRFAWADKTNGKGVIYRMIDEWNNDVPYDFKNIQYNGSWGYWAYTFNWINDKSDNSCEDLSVAQYVHTNDEGGYSHTYGNVINPCELREDGNYGYPLKLNVCVFLNTETYDSGRFYGCSSNSFGNNCYENTFGNYCSHNAFGNDCSRNAFGDSCNYNAFGNDCKGNSLGNSCWNNALGNGCQRNSFGNGCYANAFENYCNRIAFGNDCNRNSFGDSCSYIKFASDSSASTKYDYYQFNHFGVGCKYIVFTGTEPDSSSQQVQNYNFAQGLRGTDSAYLTIDGKRSRAYETYISRDTDGSIKESVIADKLDKMINISYEELYNLRRDGKLIPGQQYRITDYNCTTKQENTKSAGHVFDIIVTADDESTLNEVARAIKHDGDTYFTEAGANLNGWKLWYTLDNDTNRFAWADKTNGKGVIYRMIDEWNNDVPYDFKNIQYNGSWGYWAYTFNWINDKSDNSCEDLSVEQYAHTNDEGRYSHTCGNVIKPYGKDIHSNPSSSFMLNKCVFLNTESYNNGTYLGCYSNAIGDECHDNIFGNGCYNNTLGNGCFSNTFGDSCTDNSFGCGCYENMVRDYSSFNTFGKECNYIYLGKSCFYNTFGNDCQQIHFEENKTSTITKFYKNNRFGDGCSCILFGQTTEGGINNYVKNYIFAQGTRSFNTVGDVYLHIDGERNRNYETYVGFTSRSSTDSDLQQKCLLDIFL